MCDFVVSGNRILGLVIVFQKSKCNQAKKKEKACIPCLCEGLIGGRVCAVHEILHMLRLRKIFEEISPSDSLLQWSDGSVFSYADMGDIMKKLCLVSDMDPKKFTPHSLRAGGCVDYIGWGVDISTVQDLGRWKCMDSMTPYRKRSSEDLVKLTFRILNRLSID
jgi:hypothetical protein